MRFLKNKFKILKNKKDDKKELDKYTLQHILKLLDQEEIKLSLKARENETDFIRRYRQARFSQTIRIEIAIRKMLEEL